MPGSPRFEAEQEIRLALVLYGGVSLAVYMNGVTRELFELVRATAPNAANDRLYFDDKLEGAGEVYRTLGRMLGLNPIPLQQLDHNTPVRTRFVIDVISGTSAGGINGVVLAKALANQQRIDSLPELWVKQADISNLINDSRSLDDGPANLGERGVKLDHPEALLNGHRLYLKVLDVLNAMDVDPILDPSLYVDELDLFVTTTDLDGLRLPIQLANEAVIERRYKNVFHFVYARASASGEDRNDFTKVYNPFLAFAARCTSSFPFAFEPMRLDDVKSLDPYYGNERKFTDAVDDWRRLFRPYSPDDFPQRSFGDGGYLDNKPFTYATDTLMRRRANLRTHRKLVYVEPSPERFFGANPPDKPDAISNVVKALVTLPGYETIREDIERVHQRNRLIERVRSITDDVDRDVRQGAPRPANPASGDAYRNSDLARMIRVKGIAYGGYHRLKVAAVTDDLSSLIARIARIEEDSQDYQAIRELVAAWRRRTYKDFFDPNLPLQAQQSENRFLIDLDLSYRLRRINFLRTKIEDLYGMDLAALRQKWQLVTSNQELAQIVNGGQFSIDVFRQGLRTIKNSLSDTFVDLRRLGRDLRAARWAGLPLRDLVPQVAKEDWLRPIRNIPDPAGRRAAADHLMKDRPPPERPNDPPETSPAARAFNAMTDYLRAAMRLGTVRASAECGAALADDNQLLVSTKAARLWIGHYYEYYDDYDMITFPITYGTDAGEAAKVDIIRVSPLDARSLIDEGTQGAPGKLAGTSLFHFGGFLDELWRQNDLLWGRLDAAECIINMLLPGGGPDAQNLIGQAHWAILAQELRSATISSPYYQLLVQLQQHLNDGAQAPNIQKQHRPDREQLVCDFSRATTVVGEIFDNIVQQRHLPGHQAAMWIARAGSLLWGVVEVSVPGRLTHLIFRRWLTLLYLFESFLIIAGVIFSAPSMERFGLLTLAVTLAVNVAVVLTGEFLQNRQGWLRRLFVGLSIILVILIILGGIELAHLLTCFPHPLSSLSVE